MRVSLIFTHITMNGRDSNHPWMIGVYGIGFTTWLSLVSSPKWNQNATIDKAVFTPSKRPGTSAWTCGELQWCPSLATPKTKPKWISGHWPVRYPGPCSVSQCFQKQHTRWDPALLHLQSISAAAEGPSASLSAELLKSHSKRSLSMGARVACTDIWSRAAHKNNSHDI